MLICLFLNVQLVRSDTKCFCKDDCSNICPLGVTPDDGKTFPTTPFDKDTLIIYALTDAKTFDVSTQTNPCSFKTTEGSKLTFSNVATIGFTADGLMLGQQVKLTTPTATITLKANTKSLNLAGEVPAGFTNPLLTVILPASDESKLIITGTLDSSASFMTITASSAFTVVVPHGKLDAMMKIFSKGENVNIKEADSVCIGTDETASIPKCEKVDNSADFYFAEALPPTVADTAIVVSLLPSLQIDASIFQSKCTFKLEDSGAALVIDGVKTIDVSTTNSAQVNNLFIIATNFATFNVPGALAITGSANFGTDADTKIVVLIGDVPITATITGTFTATVEHSTTLAKALVTFSIGFVNQASFKAGPDVTIQVADVYCLTNTGRDDCLKIKADGKFWLINTLPTIIPSQLYSTINSLVLDSSLVTSALTLNQMPTTSVQIVNSNSFEVAATGIIVGQITVPKGKVEADVKDKELSVKFSAIYTTPTDLSVTIKLLQQNVLATFTGTAPTTGDSLFTVASDMPANLFISMGSIDVEKYFTPANVKVIQSQAKTICDSDHRADTTVACPTDKSVITSWKGINIGDEVTISNAETTLDFTDLFKLTIKVSSKATVILPTTTSFQITATDTLIVGDNSIGIVASATEAHVQIPLSNNDHQLTSITGKAGVFSGMTITLLVTIDHTVLDLSQLESNPTKMEVSSSLTPIPTVGVIGTSKKDYLTVVNKDSKPTVTVAEYTENPFYCIATADADKAACTKDIAYPYTVTFLETLDSNQLVSSYSQTIKSYLPDNQINISSLESDFTFTYAGNAKLQCNLVVFSVTKLSSPESDRVKCENSNTKPGSIKGENVAVYNATIDGPKLDLSFTTVLSTSTLNVILNIQQIEVSGTGSASDNKRVILMGEAVMTLTQGTNIDFTKFKVSPLITTSDQEAKLKRVITCPAKNNDDCLSQVKTVEVDATSDSSLFYDPTDWNTQYQYHPQIEKRQKFPAYIYLGFMKAIMADISMLKVAEDVVLPLVVPAPTPQKGQLFEDGVSTPVSDVLYKGATDLELGLTTVTMKANGNAIPVDVAQAPSAINLEVGQRLNVVSGSSEEKSPIQLALKLTQEDTVIAFDKVNAKGPKFTVNVEKGKKLDFFTGSSKQDELKEIFAVQGEGSVNYSEGTPENPVLKPTSKKGGLSGGAIAGIVIACIVVVAAAVVIPIVVLKKMKATRVTNAPSSTP